MKFEYLLFNLIIFSGPIFFGLQPKYNFRDKFLPALISVFIAAIPFIIWDSIVTGIHWNFNNNFILGIKIFSLPIEEIMFFFSVPLACLFLWEMIIQNSKDKELIKKSYFQAILPLLPILSGAFLYLDKIYTSLVFLSIFFISELDLKLTCIFKRKQFLVLMLMVVGFILVFNGYLTARPVVLYSKEFITNIRIITIPIEDFGYGISLIYLATIVYEKLKKKFNVREKTLSFK